MDKSGQQMSLILQFWHFRETIIILLPDILFNLFDLMPYYWNLQEQIYSRVTLRGKQKDFL